MPLKTFFNLPEEKRKKILRVCFTEFAGNDFNSASLARIIKKLNLARGSFYRYFKNKADLYQYLYHFAMEEILGDIRGFLKDSHKDFYATWVEFGLASLQKEKDYPNYLEFLSKAAMERRPEIFGLKSKTRIQLKMSYISELITCHQKTGQVRKDVNTDLLALMMIHTRYALRHYCFLHYDIHKKTSVWDNFASIPKDHLKNILNDYRKLIEGMFKPQRQNKDT